MKKLILTFSILFVAAVAMNTTLAQIDKGSKIEFSKDTHDYGSIKYDADPYCTFEFKNTGNEPLIISNAKGSCGCTVPEWSKEPIAPGASGSIRVKYDTKRPGPINKAVTVFTNVVTGKDDKGMPIYYEATLKIKGEVGPAPEGGAPVNNTGAPTGN
ncbi:MAG: DUF1573 domain-containing protein [Flavobacteriia bacterium]|nr:DUF1573 domain-containing protein [Flavobacteriia bacterium]